MTGKCATGQSAADVVMSWQLTLLCDFRASENHGHAAGTRRAAAAAAAAGGAAALPIGRQQAGHQSVPRAVPKAQGRSCRLACNIISTCVSVSIKPPHKCCTSRHLHNDRSVLHTPVNRLNTSAVPCQQVQSLELRTNVLAAYVCGGHADEVRWRFAWLAQDASHRQCWCMVQWWRRQPPAWCFAGDGRRCSDADQRVRQLGGRLQHGVRAAAAGLLHRSRGAAAAGAASGCASLQSHEGSPLYMAAIHQQLGSAATCCPKDPAEWPLVS